MDTIKMAEKKHLNFSIKKHITDVVKDGITDSLGTGNYLKLAIVGHTNTGKTSLLRTLLRDSCFGDVKNAAATTRHVERAIIKGRHVQHNLELGDEQNLVALYDTPGLEDASGVMDWLEDHTSSRRDGVERLQFFLASDLAHGTADDDFSQEAKVIRQVLSSDIAIYVIDAREPVLAKYKDELTILSWSAIPVMPVFNFTTARNNNIDDWQQMLARRNLHVSTLFDSIAFQFDDEMILWQNLATMLINDSNVQTLIDSRTHNWQNLYEDAKFIIADFLLNIASYVQEIDEDTDHAPTLEIMKTAVKKAEQKMHQELLEVYKFYDSEVANTPLNIHEYQQDPFDKEVIKQYGIRTSSGAAAGALVGMGIDVAALGTTLGLGTAIGGFFGGVLSNKHSITNIIRGTKRLFIDPATLTLLATRANILHDTLRHRGHASNNKEIQTETEKAAFAPWHVDNMPTLLKKARNKVEWSSLSGFDTKTAAVLREEAAKVLTTSLTMQKNS